MARTIFIFLLFLTILLFSILPAFAQLDPCGTGDKMIPRGNGSLKAYNSLQRIHENIQFLQSAGKISDTIIFPTVIHIIHDNGVGDITDEQVMDGLRVINEDFNRMNADTSDTRDVFKPFAAAVKFKFLLAKLDSNGDSTTAIVRVDTSLIPHPEPTSQDFDNVKFISHWPSDMYYNIWLVRAIQDGPLGYAQYPGTDFTYGGPWETWGVVMRNDQFGTIGSSSAADGRTATHEIGHTFGLYHTFLSSSAGCGSKCDTTGDEVCDTPPNTSSFSCPQTKNSCSNDTSGPSAYTTDVVDQLENFMSYNSCQNMFSQGQRTRMKAMIASFPTLQNLSSDANLIATGLMLPTFAEMEDRNLAEINPLISPNPITDQFTVSFGLQKPPEDFSLYLTDALGRKVLSIGSYPFPSKEDRNIQVPVGDVLSPGLYFLVLESRSFKVVRKLVKN